MERLLRMSSCPDRGAAPTLLMRENSCVQANPGTPRQCASYDNRFTNNTIGTVYAGSASQAVWSMSPSGLTYAGGSGCSIPSGKQRLITSGNT